MKNPPSKPIQIAAFLFLAGGLLNLILAVTRLTVVNTSTDLEELRSTVYQIIQVITIGSSVLNILAGIFLMKLKRWAYILGFILVILALGLHIFAIIQVGTTKWYGLSLSIAILILLINGRKNFNKQP